MNNVSRRFCRRQHGTVQDHATLRIAQNRMEVVRCLCARTQLRQIDRHADRQAKQIHRLVQKMRGQIVPDTTSRTGLFAPAITHLRTEAVEMRFEIRHLTQRSFANQRFKRQEITVPATIMENRQQSPKAFCQCVQLACLRQRDRERFIHHHVLARFQRGFRQREVRVIGGGNDD
ncbi:hypothetical protein D3C71_1585050 [compost metagenome]